MFYRICGIALTCGFLAACSGASPAAPSSVLPELSPVQALSPKFSHITVVLLENYSYEELIGNSSAKYLNQLANGNALFTASHGVTHPSQPNYLALFSGSTQGVTSDNCPLSFSAANLASGLASHGFTFQGYAENWPSSGNPCFAASSASVASKYLYWRKHAPWTDFTNVAYRTYGHPYGAPGTTLAGTVNFVVPNICDDMHDCGIAAADAWLSRNIPPMLSYDSSHNGLLIVTFDEGAHSATNHIVTILSGAGIARGKYSQPINHYNVLRLIESNFGLPLLGYSASASPISGIP